MKRIPGLALIAIAGTARAATLNVTIDNIPDAQGNIRIALCSNAEFLRPTCQYTAQTPARSGSVQLALNDVAPGTYALQAFQDRNGNRKLDRSFIGMPQEPLGFSRDPKLRFGPPDFDQADIAVTPAGGAITVHLITH